MLMAVWDDSNQTLQIANAGSVQPLFVSIVPPPTPVQDMQEVPTSSPPEPEISKPHRGQSKSQAAKTLSSPKSSSTDQSPGVERVPNLTMSSAISFDPQTLSAPTVSVRTIKAEGFPLGLFPNAEYEEFTLSTQPGDLIVFFSDGIIDAQNARGEMFGDERLVAVLQAQHQPTTAATTAEAILDAVAAFQSGTDHFDDETVVILRAL
jgi:serine/threonine protein phosphatase PrpC